MDSNYINILSLSLAIISIGLAVYFYIKSKKNKSPLYEIKSLNVISSEIDKVTGLNIFYENKEIETLTVSKIIIWNSGNTTILDSDIPKTNKFSLSLENEDKLFDFSLVYNSDKHNGLKLKKIKENIKITFDYLEKNEGFIIKIIHSGEHSSIIDVQGRVIGNSLIKRIKDYDPEIGLFSIIFSSFSFTFIIFFLIYIGVTLLKDNYILTSIIFLLITILLAVLFLKALLKKRMPKRLQEFFEKD